MPAQDRTNLFSRDGGDAIIIHNGGDISVYSDEGTTAKLTIDGATGNIVVGTDGYGGDLTLYSGTAGDKLVWDASEEKLTITGTNAATALDVADGNVVINDNLTVTAGTLTVGASGAGTDVTFYSGTAGDTFLWDASEECLVITGTDAQTALSVPDGNVVIADNLTVSTGAFDVTAGATTLEALTIGVNDTGADVTIYGDTAAAYLLWDASADALLGYGNATLQIGESTTGVVTAGGKTMVYGYATHKTNALTGTLRGVRGNAGVLVASAAGTAIGVAGRAANGLSTTATDGVNLGTARGGEFLVSGVGLAAAGPSVLSAAQGVYVQLDIDAANLTITDARGIYVNVQSGNAAANTLTACNLAYLEYESVVGTAPAINSAIKIATVGGATGATCLIDASTFNLAVTDTDKVALIKFKNDAGATKTVFYDTSDNALSVA